MAAKTTKGEALNEAKVLLGRIEACQASLRVLERCKLSGGDRAAVAEMKSELGGLLESTRFHLKVIRESK